MKENWEIHWKDYYTILQIHPLAEPEVVKAAYIKLANKYAPDKNPSIPPEKMKDLNEAFEIISNPEKRRRYYLAYQQLINPKPVNGNNWTTHSKSEPTSDPPYTRKSSPSPHPKQKPTHKKETNPKKKTRDKYRPYAYNGLGNLHAKRRYASDNSNLNPNISKPISNEPIIITLLVIALCILVASWYPYIVFHNKWWLFLCIPVSIVCLPPAIIWFQQLISSRRNKNK